jgi:hypothetical protein
MVSSLFHDETAGRDSFADLLAEAIDRAVAVPRDVVEEFERMAAHSEAEQFGFCLQALVAGWFIQDRRQLL